ncbi:LysM domain-containing protein [Streptococcaceae bacterium ESL0687]|nr:LysM domain-containing protein [Streptococcaceae bacterium ESL0687]
MVNEEKDFRKLKHVVWKTAAAGLLAASFTLATEVSANEYDGIWQARTVDQIQNDLHRELANGGTVYLIVWGDTLGNISQATNITVEKLASINNIKNVNLIYAGNTLVFCGDSVQVYGQNQEKLADVPIDKTDKINPQAPVGASPKAENKGTTNSADSKNSTELSTSTSSNLNSKDANKSEVPTSSSSDVSSGKNDTSTSSSSEDPTDTFSNNPKPAADGSDPEGRYTVWYQGYGNSSYDLGARSHRFTSANAALNWIRNYHLEIKNDHSIDGAYGTIDLGSGVDSSVPTSSSDSTSKDSSNTGSSTSPSSEDNTSTSTQPETPKASTADRWTVWWWIRWDGSNGDKVGNAIVPGSHVFASFEEAQAWLNANGNLAGTPGIGATAKWPSEATGESSQTLYAPFWVGDVNHSQDMFPGNASARYFNSRQEAQDYINNTLWPSLKSQQGQAGILTWQGGVIY